VSCISLAKNTCPTASPPHLRSSSTSNAEHLASAGLRVTPRLQPQFRTPPRYVPIDHREKRSTRRPTQPAQHRFFNAETRTHPPPATCPSTFHKPNTHVPNFRTPTKCRKRFDRFSFPRNPRYTPKSISGACRFTGPPTQDNPHYPARFRNCQSPPPIARAHFHQATPPHEAPNKKKKKSSPYTSPTSTASK